MVIMSNHEQFQVHRRSFGLTIIFGSWRIISEKWTNLKKTKTKVKQKVLMHFVLYDC